MCKSTLDKLIAHPHLLMRIISERVLPKLVTCSGFDWAKLPHVSRSCSLVTHINKHGYAIGYPSNQNGPQQEQEPQWNFENNTKASVPYWIHDWILHEILLVGTKKWAHGGCHAKYNVVDV